MPRSDDRPFITSLRAQRDAYVKDVQHMEERIVVVRSIIGRLEDLQTAIQGENAATEVAAFSWINSPRRPEYTHVSALTAVKNVLAVIGEGNALEISRMILKDGLPEQSYRLFAHKTVRHACGQGALRGDLVRAAAGRYRLADSGVLVGRAAARP